MADVKPGFVACDIDADAQSGDVYHDDWYRRLKARNGIYKNPRTPSPEAIAAAKESRERILKWELEQAAKMRADYDRKLVEARVKMIAAHKEEIRLRNQEDHDE